MAVAAASSSAAGRARAAAGARSLPVRRFWKVFANDAVCQVQSRRAFLRAPEAGDPNVMPAVSLSAHNTGWCSRLACQNAST